MTRKRKVRRYEYNDMPIEDLRENNTSTITRRPTTTVRVVWEALTRVLKQDSHDYTTSSLHNPVQPMLLELDSTNTWSKPTFYSNIKKRV